MPELKTNPPPTTEILSVTNREIDSEPTSTEDAGLAVSPETGAETQEPAGEPAFVLDEEGEVTHDPLKDTQRKLHQTTEELAKTKKLVEQLAVERQMGGGMGSILAMPRFPDLPPEVFSLDPLPREKEDMENYPANYMKRLMATTELKKTYDDMIQERTDFVRNHRDWRDLEPTMMEVVREEPTILQGKGGFERLYKRAVKEEKLKGYESAEKDARERMGNLGKPQDRTFVSPTGKVSMGIPSSKTPPRDFHSWDTQKQRQWLEQHGFVKNE